MNWNKSYDRINTCFDGELSIFGGHYTLQECLKIIKEDGYDDPDEWKDCEVGHQWAKFGLVYYDGEVFSGWTLHAEYRKGRVKATVLVPQYEDIAVKKVVKSMMEEKS